MIDAQRAQKIRLLILDVDGVLTDGRLYHNEEGVEAKGFHTQDGLGMKLLKKTGVEIAVISGRHSKATQERLQYLQIPYIYLGVEDKVVVYEKLKQDLTLQDDEIACMGDDLPDLPLLRRSGFAVTVPDAVQSVKEQAHYTTAAKGGNGAVREVCEYIMRAQGHLTSVLDYYLTR